jgi:hypothetical protein
VLATGEFEFAKHVSQEEDRFLEYVFAGQFVQLLIPGTSEYLPAVHSMHTSHVSVKSKPCIIAFEMADVVLVLMNSSTTKRPAISPTNADAVLLAARPTKLNGVVKSINGYPMSVVEPA